MGQYISTQTGKSPKGGDPQGAHGRDGKGRTPMANGTALRRRGWLLWLSGLLLIAAGCAARPPVAQVPIPAGQARIWVYRTWLPSESLNLANIEVNGVYFGSVENGGVFYRDVPPGTYHIAPQSWARDVNQDRNVALVPGQQVYVKILDLTSWATSVSASKNFQRDSFYAWLIPPQVAQVEIARDHGGI
jgi:hypothetical protein